jgi:hypothetical protein
MKMTLSELIEIEGMEYSRTLNQIAGILDRRDRGEPCDFKTAGQLYERLDDLQHNLQHLNDERRQLEDQHAGINEQREDGATQEQTHEPDWRDTLQNAWKLFFEALEALDAQARVGTDDDCLYAVRAMQRVAKDIVGWGIAAFVNAARIEAKLNGTQPNTHGGEVQRHDPRQLSFPFMDDEPQGKRS